MIKKEIKYNPIVRRMDNVSEPPVFKPMEWEDMSMDEANQYLSDADKSKWVKAHNKTANLFFINPRGQIQEVEPSGWWR